MPAARVAAIYCAAEESGMRKWLFAFCFRIASHHRRKHRRETVEDMTGDLVEPAEAPDILLDALDRVARSGLRARCGMGDARSADGAQASH